MHNNKEAKFVRSRADEERRLQFLLRQHKRIGEEIIALVLKTSAQAGPLIQTLKPKRRGQLIEFPHPVAEAQKGESHQG